MIDLQFGADAAGQLTRHEDRMPAPGRELSDSLPRQPKAVSDTGLDPRFVTDLVLKAIHAGGKTPLPMLSSRVRLPVTVLREVLNRLMSDQQVEVAWCGETDIDVQYQLTSIGQRAAEACLAQSRYVGPAPVTLAAYRTQVERQSLRQPGALRVTPQELACALADDALGPAVRDQLGAALHSSRALLLYGPSGSGKTTLARKLARLLSGPVAVPYAIMVDRQIVQFHDPALHPAPPQMNRHQEERRSYDTRWAICRRPLVHVGSGLTREMLDLRHDPGNGVYRAPPHFQANNGLLVIDDVGRHRVRADELLNRMAGPLDQGVDQLSMQGGQAEIVPFDATVVFATNLPPEEVFDDAQLRRIGYKVALGPLSEADYRNLLRRQCHQHDIDYDEAAATHLLARLHGPSRRPLLAAYPHELLGRIADFASYAGTEPRLTPAALDQAWSSMFATCGSAARAAGRATGDQ